MEEKVNTIGIVCFFSCVLTWKINIANSHVPILTACP